MVFHNVEPTSGSRGTCPVGISLHVISREIRVDQHRTCGWVDVEALDVPMNRMRSRYWYHFLLDLEGRFAKFLRITCTLDSRIREATMGSLFV